MVNNDYHLSTEYESQERTKLPCHNDSTINVTGIDIIAAVNNNNNNNNHEDIYSAVIMTRSLREFTRFIW